MAAGDARKPLRGFVLLVGRGDAADLRSFGVRLGPTAAAAPESRNNPAQLHSAPAQRGQVLPDPPGHGQIYATEGAVAR